MIEATAIVKDYAIATRDKRSYPKIPGPKVSDCETEDWSKGALHWLERYPREVRNLRRSDPWVIGIIGYSMNGCRVEVPHGRRGGT